MGPCNRTNIDFGLHCQTEDNFRDHQNAIYSLPFLKQSLDKRVFWAVFGALNVVGNFCMYIWSPLLVHSTAFLCEYRRWFQKYSKPFITLTKNPWNRRFVARRQSSSKSDTNANTDLGYKCTKSDERKKRDLIQTRNMLDFALKYILK